MFGGDGTQFTDAELGNPYATSRQPPDGQRGVVGAAVLLLTRSPTRIIPWLATGYEYNDDFTELTVNLREGVKWSDGEPFNAEDVVFTIQMLKDKRPASHDPQQLTPLLPRQKQSTT